MRQGEPKNSYKTILEQCPTVSSVCYGVTPKFPATVEME
jgi:GMP synthase PP-ATPase subunit